ncbi:MAG: type I methionyl aminopeptidase, partial [Tepidisphaeraceae bacterium]
MAIVIKSRREIELMRRAGQVACEILAMMRQRVAPGVSTYELNEIARIELEKSGAVGLSKNYPTYRPGEGFPAETCVSVNAEVVHGIPGPRQLREGDVVTLDLALQLGGYCADTATTVPVGRVQPQVQRLLDVTKETLNLAINNMKPERRWTDIARLMQYHVERNGFNVVREFVGHGIGRSMHEDPKVANFVTGEQLRGDFKLKPGMTLAVEPMVVMGGRDVEMLEDNWT